MQHLGARSLTFQGNRSETAPMTWGQRAIWKAIRWLDDDAHYFNIRRIAKVPPGVTTAQVEAVLSTFVSRHEVLRTRFHERAEGPVQEVWAEGALSLAVVEAASGAADDVAAELARELVSVTFRHAEEWPFRCALVLEDGCPASAVLVFSHLAVDFWGVRELERDLQQLLAGTGSPEPEWRPIDQARFETEGPGAARGAAAVEYWRRTLHTVPPTLFRTVDGEARPERFVRMGMDSPAAAVAATVLAERCQVSTGTVLLAATAAVLGAYTGHDTVALQLIAVNRHDERTRRLVAPMVENALFALDVGDDTFEQTVRRTFLTGMNAYRHAQYDPSAVDEILDEARKRSNGALNLGCFFNDKRMHDRWENLPETDVGPDGLRALLSRTRVTFVGSWERQDATFFLHTGYAPDTCLLYLLADTELIPRNDIDLLLRAFETLLVDSATGTLDLADFRSTRAATSIEKNLGETAP
ncbi:condensation domain-containing protein [Micromonospora sp. NPDC051925]|uniref:condensation domain-containing protein n=1 Tax=Micromonospora sp. NPDC051925 TaxID=3364288 RepID=UPI0037C61470